MFRQLIVLSAACAVTTTGWTQEKEGASKQEAMGVGSGAVIGAAAGGPVGFVLGAALGGWLGDRFHDERAQRESAEAAHARAQAELGELESVLARNKREIDRLESRLLAQQREHRSALQEALNLQVYFRTAETRLDDGAAERLARIGELIGPMDEVVVLLEGHADPRGDEAYNESLSAERAEAVREIFVGAGVPAERIAVSAEGENQSSAEDGDVDALALERRVDIRIAGSDGSRERVARRSAQEE